MPPRKRSKDVIALAKEIIERLREHDLKGPDARTERDLADHLGLPFQTVNGWFTRNAMPNADTLIALAERDGLNLNHFLLGDGPPLRGQTMMPTELAAGVRAHVVAALHADMPPGLAKQVVDSGD